MKEDSKSGGESVEAAIKRHEDFDRAINAQEEKIANLQTFANSLIANENYDRDNVEAKIKSVLERWQKLREALLEHRFKLTESQTLSDFSKDADELEVWLVEKKQGLSDDNIKDATNIQVIIIFFFIFSLPNPYKNQINIKTTIL